MQSLTYRIAGPPHKAPISSLVGDPVICQLHPDFVSVSLNGTPFILGAVTARTHAGQTWTYVVSIDDNQFAPDTIAAGKLLGILAGFNSPEKYLKAVAHNVHLSYEVFGPTESITTATKWAGNPDVSGTITGIRISQHTAGAGTVQLTLGGTNIFPAPRTLTELTQRVVVSIPITAGQRINAVTTGAIYGAAMGLQIELTIQPA
jgi:hypothetical protein